MLLLLKFTESKALTKDNRLSKATSFCIHCGMEMSIEELNVCVYQGNSRVTRGRSCYWQGRSVNKKPDTLTDWWGWGWLARGNWAGDPDWLISPPNWMQGLLLDTDQRNNARGCVCMQNREKFLEVIITLTCKETLKACPLKNIGQLWTNG